MGRTLTHGTAGLLAGAPLSKHTVTHGSGHVLCARYLASFLSFHPRLSPMRWGQHCPWLVRLGLRDDKHLAQGHPKLGFEPGPL